MIPDGWKQKEYSDITDINKRSLKGKTDPDYSLNYLDISSVVRTNVISDLKSLTFKEAPSRARRIVKPRDIIVSNVRPYLRAFAFIQDPPDNLIASTGFSVISCKEGIDPQFLFQTILSDDFMRSIKQRMVGSNYPAINASDIEETPVLLPPLPEQKKIAAILSSVDDAIQATQKVIDQTEKVKQGMLQELLTKGIGHTEFKKTEIGEIPVEWELKTLDDVATFTNGKAHEKDISEDGNFIVVNSKFISSDGEVIKKTKTNICPLHPDDIVMVMSDVPNGRAIAKCLIVREANQYSLNQRICALHSRGMNTDFLYYCLNRNKYYLSFDDGVGQTNLKKAEVLGCPVVIPSLHEQEKIVDVISSIDSHLSHEMDKKRALEFTKKGLMQDLLTGKVRV